MGALAGLMRLPGDSEPIIDAVNARNNADMGGCALETSVRTIGKVRVIAPQGRVDQATSDALRLALEPELAACTAGGAPLVLDLSGVPYISSIGLRVLMLASRQVTAQQGKMAIAELQPVVREVFQISRFDMVFRLFDSVAAAAEALSA
jgi:anti-anti-sigma factor